MRVETRHGLVLMIGTVLAAGLSLLFVVYVGRTLSAAEFGEFTALLSLISLGFAAMGPVHETVTRFSADYHGRDQVGRIRGLANLFFKRLAWVATIVLVVGVVVSPWIRQLWRMSSTMPIVTAWLIVVATLFLTTCRGILRGSHCFGALNANQVGEAALRLFAGLIVLSGILSAVNLQGAMSAYLFAVLAALLLGLLQVSALWRNQQPDSADGASILAYLGPMFIFAMLRAGHEQLDMLIVKYVLPPDDAGLYGAALSVTRVVGVVATPFATLILPMMAAARSRGESGSGSFARSVVSYLAIVVPFTLACSLWPRPVLGVLYGTGPLIEAAPFLGWLLLGRTAIYLAALVGVMLIAMGSFRFFYLYGLGLFIQLVAMFFAAKSTGVLVKVVATAQCVSLVLVLLFVIREVRRRADSPVAAVAPDGGSVNS